MTYRLFKTCIVAPLVTAVWLTSCAVSAPPPKFPEITFSHLPPIKLDVAEVEIVESYVPTLRAPNVEHEFPVTPMAAMRRWAVDRIQAGGEVGRGRVIIENASAVAVPLPIKTGVRGLLVDDQFVRYDIAMEMQIEVRSERGFRSSFATAKVEHSRTAPETISLAERDKLFFDLTEELIRMLNSELELNIRRHMQRDLL